MCIQCVLHVYYVCLVLCFHLHVLLVLLQVLLFRLIIFSPCICVFKCFFLCVFFYAYIAFRIVFFYFGVGLEFFLIIFVYFSILVFDRYFFSFSLNFRGLKLGEKRGLPESVLGFANADTVILPRWRKHRECRSCSFDTYVFEKKIHTQNRELLIWKDRYTRIFFLSRQVSNQRSGHSVQTVLI